MSFLVKPTSEMSFPVRPTSVTSFPSDKSAKCTMVKNIRFWGKPHFPELLHFPNKKRAKEAFPLRQCASSTPRAETCDCKE